MGKNKKNKNQTTLFTFSEGNFKKGTYYNRWHEPFSEEEKRRNLELVK